MRRVRVIACIGLAIVLGYAMVNHTPTAHAAVGINPQISLQGKIVNSNNANISNGTYNMQFKIYQDGTSAGVGSTLKWTENYLVSASNGVAISAGIFQVNLGSTTAFGGSVDWNQDTLWLSMQIGSTSSCTISTSFQADCGGDGEMTPYIRLTTTPYALNADRIDGLDSAALGQLAANQVWSGTNLFQNTSNSSTAFRVLDSGSNTYLTIDTSGASAALGNTGIATSTTIGSTASTSTTTIQSGSGGILLQPGTGNDVVFNQGAGSNLQLTATAAPTVSQLAITNAGQGVTTSNANGLSITYVGGSAAVEAAGARIDLTPGGTTGGTWSGLRIVTNSTGAVSGVTEYGVKLEGPGTPGAGTETAMYIGTGWDVGLDVQSGSVNLKAFASGGNPADPSSPASGNLAVFARSVSGRMLLKMKDPAGSDRPFQPALFGGSNIAMYAPTSSTTVTGGFGTLWAKGSSTGTVSTVSPSTTSPALTGQIHRTKHLNLVTTTNQDMGIKTSASDGLMFWRGNSAGLGGFFFYTRFVVDAYAASTVRLFAGMASSTTAVVASDTVAGDVVGLWHDTTDSSSTFNLVTRDNSTTTKTAISLSNAIAANNGYDFYMYCAPNGSTIYYRLEDLVNGVSYEGSTSTTIPRNTIFMGPQVEMSNGTANITVNTVGIGVARIYAESDR